MTVRCPAVDQFFKQGPDKGLQILCLTPGLIALNRYGWHTAAPSYQGRFL